MSSVFFDYSLVIFLFFLISILYSSVGFGGGSSYLAILALTSLAFTQIRATALLCNIIVVSGNVFIFYRKKELNVYKMLPLVLLSIPFSYLGGFLKISKNLFFILLGTTLILAAISMWISKKIATSNNALRQTNNTKNGAIGSIIGFISGIVGIGGGIFLAPILHFINWDSPKKIAATTSVFIFVNSIAGFLGQSSNLDFEIDWNLTSILLIVVFIGGQIGSRISNNFFTPIQLKKATAVLIAFVGFKILYDFIF